MQGEVGWLGLEGRVCVVTGAASGIGWAVVQELLRAGARVALLDHNPGALNQRIAEIDQRSSDWGWPRAVVAGKTTPATPLPARMCLGVTCDVGDEASVAHAAQQVTAELGAASVLINNAGVLRPGTLSDVSLEHWSQLLAVNLTGYLLCARAFGAGMRAAGRGSIVNIASISAYFPQTASGAYSASKAGILLLSKQLAVEWGASGVRSNCVCPGMIRTALSAKFYEEPGFEAKRAAVTASRRIGEPLDIANAVLFLASDRSSYVNGAELLVDGGMHNMLMDMVPRPGYNNT
jgi:glucose 1-dehydrogenase